jgi:hypothetical protein
VVRHRVAALELFMAALGVWAAAVLVRQTKPEVRSLTAAMAHQIQAPEVVEVQITHLHEAVTAALV